MPTHDIAALVVSFYEAIHNAHDLSVIETTTAPDVVCRWSGLPEMHGRAELRAALAADLEGFPDHRMDLDQIVVEGDVAATRWTYRGTHTGTYYGIPATGRAIVSTVVAFDRFGGEALIDNCVVFDNYDVMQQLGIVPAADAVLA